MALKDIPRDALHTRILQKIQQEKDVCIEKGVQWDFSPQTAFSVIDVILDTYKKIYGEDHRRRSRRLTVSHWCAVGGYNDQREIANPRLTDGERIIGLLHDVFEDTQLTFEDARAWGILDEDIYSLDCLTRRVKTDGTKEPWFDYLDRIVTDLRAISRKKRDISDNIYGIDPLKGDYKIRRILSMQYLIAAQKPNFSVEKFIESQSNPSNISIAFKMISEGSSQSINLPHRDLQVVG